MSDSTRGDLVRAAPRADGRVRLFVGFGLPPAVGAALAARAAAVFDERAWRLQRVLDLHVTLWFLGERPDALVEPLARELALALASCRAPVLELGTFDAFPDTARPRAAFARVHASGEDAVRLAAVRGAAGVAIERAGIVVDARERERFVPHVTVARPRGAPTWPADVGGGVPRRADEVSAPANTTSTPRSSAPSAAAWTADEVVLCASVGDSPPQRYPALARFPLRG